MAWIQIKLNTTGSIAEQLSDHLTKLGALSITFLDSHDTPIFEPLPGETRLWGDTDVVALFEANTNMKAVLISLLQTNLLPSNFKYKIEAIEDKDWQREWMDNYHPLKFGNRLWICPSWREIPDPNAVNIMLDPGLAFGTGTHPTTSLCLEWLDGLDLAGKTVIDFGCGSGILAIAALKLGAKSAIGIDIDPQAILASNNNAKNNNVDHNLQLYLAKDAPDTLQADIVLANILAGPLKELYPVISSLVMPKGMLCLSGILTEQANSLVDVYTKKFKLDAVTESDEWCRITGRLI